MARSIRRYGKLTFGATLVFAVIAVAVLAPVLSSHDPNRVNLMARLTPPAWQVEGNARRMSRQKLTTRSTLRPS